MKTYKVHTFKCGMDYDIAIFKEKNKDTYRWVNFTRGHICTCEFNSEEEALEDLREYERQGKIVILTS